MVRAPIVEGPFGLTLCYYRNLTKLCGLFKDLEKAPAFFGLQRSIKGLKIIGKQSGKKGKFVELEATVYSCI